MPVVGSEKTDGQLDHRRPAQSPLARQAVHERVDLDREMKTHARTAGVAPGGS
jgi:hypothetical protein